MGKKNKKEEEKMSQKKQEKKGNKCPSVLVIVGRLFWLKSNIEIFLTEIVRGLSTE